MKDTITLAELRQTDLYRKEQTRPLRELLGEKMKQEPDFIAYESNGCLSGEPYAYDAKPVPLYRNPRELSDSEIMEVVDELNKPNVEKTLQSFARAILKKASEK